MPRTQKRPTQDHELSAEELELEQELESQDLARELSFSGRRQLSSDDAGFDFDN